MAKPNPKFSMGEEVYMVGSSQRKLGRKGVPTPHCSAPFDGVVSLVEYQDGRYLYDLNGNTSVCYDENLLRKKYKGVDFETMMESLLSCEPLTISPREREGA